MDVNLELNDKLKLKGHLILKHIRDGKVIDVRDIDNVICDVGVAKVAQLMGGTSTGGFGYMATGTGTTSETASDTVLGTEVLRVATTNTNITTTTTDDTIQFVASFTFTASYAITEAGIFDASTAGNLLAHKTFSAVNVVNGDGISLTWKVQA